MAKCSFRTKAQYVASCHRCGWECSAGNALAMAARHFDNCGGYVWCESTVAFVWDPERRPANG